MANVDRPNGFKLVKTFSGQPVNALIRSIGVADGEDIFVGDALNLESGLADPAATNDADLLGVAVGFGKKNTMSQQAGDVNPDNLTTLFYDDSANTHTDWVVYYVPFSDGVFEVQTATALTLAIGATADLSDATGDSTSGQSRQEITTSSNADFIVVGTVDRPDNDSTLVWGRYLVTAVKAEQAFHA
jgi:hypothetical protein